MSSCPYGKDAIRELLTVSESIGSSFEWNVWFSGEHRGDSLITGLRSGSVEEEKIILAVQRLYPSSFRDFLWLVTNENGSVEQAIREMELDTLKISRWISLYGFSALASSYDRSTRLNVVSSPTLYFKNRRYEPEFTSDRVLFEYCQLSNSSPLFCQKFGECLVSDDCESDSGQVARCEYGDDGKGSCHFYKDTPVSVIQLLPKDSSYTEQNKMVGTTMHLFPTANITTFREGTPEGDSLIDLYELTVLPFFVFDSSLSQLTNFDLVESGIERCFGGYRFRANVMKGNFYLNRRPIENETLFFIQFDSPLYESLRREYPNITILPAFNRISLESREYYTQITSELQKCGVTVTPVEFCARYFEDIQPESIVWMLENNQKVTQFDSPESFTEIARKR